MKILIISTSYPQNESDYRGIFVKEMADILTKKGNEILLLKPAMPRYRNIFGGYGALEMIRENPLRITILFPCAAEQILKGFFKAVSADMIISHWLMPSGILGAFFSRTFKIPHCCVVHSVEPWMFSNFFCRKIIGAFIVPDTETFICVNKQIASRMEEIINDSSCKSQVRIIPMGITFSEYREIKRNQKAKTGKILFLGRLVKIKGAEVLLKAMSGIEGIEVTIAGNGPLEDHLKSLGRETGVKVLFAGEVSPERKRILLAEHDILVIPSIKDSDGREEGVPRVLFEGLASGMIVIASRTGGMPEIISHGKNGFLFNQGDSEDLKKIMVSLIKKEWNLKKMINNGIQTAEKYDWNVIMEKLLPLLQFRQNKME
jgi:glycosyltransferase involved in cell wall biosynthesis